MMAVDNRRERLHSNCDHNAPRENRRPKHWIGRTAGRQHFERDRLFGCCDKYESAIARD